MVRSKEARISREQRENLLRKNDAWLSGILEVGGGMGFSTYFVKGRVYSYPYIHITNSVYEHSELIKREVVRDGRVVERAGSWEWKVEGETAALIARAIKKYAPSRSATIERLKTGCRQQP